MAAVTRVMYVHLDHLLRLIREHFTNGAEAVVLPYQTLYGFDDEEPKKYWILIKESSSLIDEIYSSFGDDVRVAEDIKLREAQRLETISVTAFVVTAYHHDAKSIMEVVDTILRNK